MGLLCGTSDRGREAAEGTRELAERDRPAGACGLWDTGFGAGVESASPCAQLAGQ